MKVYKPTKLLSVVTVLSLSALWSTGSQAELQADEGLLREALASNSENHLARAKLVQLLVKKEQCAEANSNAQQIIVADSVPELVKDNLNLLIQHCHTKRENQLASSFALLVKPRVGYDSRPTSFSQDLGFAGSLLEGIPVFGIVDRPVLDFYDPAALGADVRDEYENVSCVQSACDAGQGDEYTAISAELAYAKQFEIFDSKPSQLIVRNRFYNRSYANNDHYDVNSIKAGLEFKTELNNNLAAVAGITWWQQKSAADLEFSSVGNYMGLNWNVDHYEASLILESLRRNYSQHEEIDRTETRSATLLFSTPLFDEFVRLSAHYKFSENDVWGFCQVCRLNFSAPAVSQARFLDYHSSSYGFDIEKPLNNDYVIKAGWRYIDYKGLSSGVDNYSRVKLELSKKINSSLELNINMRSERHNSSSHELDDRNVVSLGLGWVWDG
ncbi:hypothetical protein [uncultured Pseudoteredinibacter sp.]|uniref:hypothetical protein n=1 Tax=uncultured Pseudoteredinibacter sp. TaxID=1641701 RepID=UPI0026298EC5|nr:hypothetical protein [uncultured Pseudoteredinibacter sp.]